MPQIDWTNANIWINAGTAAVAIGGALLGQSWIASNPQAAAGIGALVAVVNALLHAYAGPRSAS